MLFKVCKRIKTAVSIYWIVSKFTLTTISKALAIWDLAVVVDVDLLPTVV